MSWNRIKAARKEKGLTMDELAHLMGVSQSAIVRWENGTTEPKIKIIRSLAEILDVSELYLLGVSEEMITTRQRPKITNAQQQPQPHTKKEMLNRMKFEFYGEKTPCGNGFTQPVITKECTFEDALRYLENGVVFDDELSRGLKIVEFKKVDVE